MKFICGRDNLTEWKVLSDSGEDITEAMDVKSLSISVDPCSPTEAKMVVYCGFEIEADPVIQTEVDVLLSKLEQAILETPTGALRNTLTEANILLRTLQVRSNP